MEHHYYVNSGKFLLCFLHVLQLLWGTSGLDSAKIESDRLALLDFKSRIAQDPLQIMSSWNDSTSFCNWIGVECSPVDGRVAILNLESQKLVGSIPPSLGNLTCLTGFNLRHNNFRGQIPEEIGRIQGLQDLNLSHNYFGGEIPMNLTHCTGLKALDVRYNELVGRIPDCLSSLLQLEFLRLGGNYLTGIIPAWIGNFSSLKALSLTFDQKDDRYMAEPISVGLKGSIGYIPPEYMGDPSMFFEEENDEEISPNHKEEKEIISDNDPQGGIQSGEIEEHLVSVMRIGLACSTTSPRERMPMKDILKNLYAIRDSFLRSSNRNRRRLR
ncbi:hypothetical protein LWI28_026883 [Acer negundo]|uniref:Leucine-rich repeat-containing N-terminal plant-type domain-containing protein n=1 Tax=Acer negundo TaxID=4023 RepID=A0AAD5I7P2_ACENE|nr:hypothetical protein LWI28_026883 [Acer negundo]